MYNYKVRQNSMPATSDFLDGLVASYRDGLPGAAQNLVEAFEPILYSYHRLLGDGIFDVDDRDTLSLLAMFGKASPFVVAQRLSGSIRRQMDTEDIRQELVLVLLLTAQRYVNISSTYRYVLKERLLELLGDSIIYDRTADVDPEEIADQSHLGLDEISQIDEAWVQGRNTGEGWDRLTPLQRNIIRYVYCDELAEAVAAKKLKLSLRQLQRHKSTARAILAEYFGIEE